MVGATGIEPAASRSRTERTTAVLRPDHRMDSFVLSPAASESEEKLDMGSIDHRVQGAAEQFKGLTANFHPIRTDALRRAAPRDV